ncbi:MAG: hypothetical protein MI922_03085, partial [Bacteroidales bacterium]|nr:hypothetical protein [Bacteroidales bacterium]
TSDQWNIYCNTDPIRLVASGGQTYDWYGTYDPTLVTKLSATDVADPYFYPDTTGSFHFSVDVSGECWTDTTLQLEVHIINSPVASFALNSQEACSPFDPIVTNNTNTFFAENEIWTIRLGSKTYEIDQDTLPRTFTLDLPDNNTDTVQVFQITLGATGASNSCGTEKTKYVSVLPQVNAKFSVLDTMGCHPFPIDIVDSSWGHINDTTSYQWFFGDGKTSDDTVPTKSYLNYTDKDTIYDLQLVLTSPLGCTDTAHQDVYVYPFINSSLSIDNSVGCSPLTSVLKSNSSIGVDTFYYHVDYFYGDTTFKKTTTDEFNWFHVDTNYASDPDTLLVSMYGVNRFGCIDTLDNSPREIVVFPEVKSTLDIDTNAICDLGTVTATNHSVGVELLYKWSFGDGTEKYDSLPTPQIKTYFNRTNADTNFTISLVSTSKYYCRDTVDTVVTVHPYISADFSMEKESNCVPLDVKFNNLCVRGHQFTWDLGDGSPTSDTTVPSFRHVFWNPLVDRDTTYNIQLIARNNEGCSDTISKSLLLFPQVVADFEISDTFGCNPVDVDFTNTSTGKDLIYNWDFGNGITNSSSATTFTESFQNLYQNDTTYILELEVVNAQGCDSVMYDSVTVLANIDVQFDLPNSDSCSPFIIRPSNRSSIGTKEFIWDFGPLGNSNDHTPVLTPFVNNSSTTDTVEVSLIGYGANDAIHLACADTFTKEVYIYPDIIASFDLAINESCQPYQSSIINNTTLKTGVNFRWMLDSLFYSSLENPKDLFIYNNTDSNQTHIMQLFTETDKGCTHDTVDTITVYSHVKPYFTMDKSEICSGDSINFDRSLSFGNLTYIWDFDDGIIDTTNSETLIHSYVQTVDSVHKYVTLTAINSAGCDSTVSHRVVVNPAMHASFEIEHDTSCEPFISKIINNSYPSSGTNYFWKLNGGFYATGENPADLNIHNETENYADYTLTLEASTQYNCIDDTSLSFTVLPVVEPDFTLDTRELCHGDSVGIDRTLTRVGGTKEFDWYFEDNLSTTTDSAKMFRTYTNESDDTKILDITLRVSNGHPECDKTHRDSIQVHPKVDADFEFTNDEYCQPLSTEFKNFTNNQAITSFSWYLDNSIFSNQKVPNTLTIHNHTKYDSAHSVTMYAVSHNKTFNNASVKECRGDVTMDLMVYSNLESNFTMTPKRLCSGDSIHVDPSYSKTGVQNNGYEYIWSIDGTKYNNLEEAQYITMENKKDLDPKVLGITLEVWEEENNDVCKASKTETVTIYPEVFADFNIDSMEVCYPHISKFKNHSNDAATEYIWDFGDGRTSTDEDPYHTFENLNFVDDKTFTIKLESKSRYNCVDSASKSIVIYAKPNAAIHLQKKAGCPPLIDT